jgi:hypothetical protein
MKCVVCEERIGIQALLCFRTGERIRIQSYFLFLFGRMKWNRSLFSLNRREERLFCLCTFTAKLVKTLSVPVFVSKLKKHLGGFASLWYSNFPSRRKEKWRRWNSRVERECIPVRFRILMFWIRTKYYYYSLPTVHFGFLSRLFHDAVSIEAI